MHVSDVAFLTDDFAFDPKDRQFTPNGTALYRCVLPAMVTGSIVGRPAFNLTEGFGCAAISTPDSTGKWGYGTVVLKLLLAKQQYRQVVKAKSLGQRIIVDVDDHYPSLHESNIAYTVTDPAKNPNINRDWAEAIIKEADTITVSTPFLLDYYQSEGHPDVRLVRNGILPSMWTQIRQHTDRKPVIGWLGATGWRSGDLETLAGWLPEFVKRNRLTFHHSGHIDGMPFAGELAGLPSNVCSIFPQVPTTRLPNAYQQFDIGLIPLSHIDFNVAKSNLKGLEMSASGIPWVASDLPEYRLLASETGLMAAESDVEWVEGVSCLLNAKARREAAEAARDVVLRDWTIDNRTEEWKAVLAG